jgi:hypothetical protein
MRISDSQLRDLLARAEELDRASRQPAGSDIAGLLGAAEEVGFSRRAVQQALAEQFGLPALPLARGTLIWARAADGKFYAAEVIASEEETTHLRFLGGSEHHLPLEELRTCVLNPGARITCNWPKWGTWTCTVVAYDREKQRVKLNDGWGSTKWFPLAELWMAQPKASPARRRMDAILIGSGALLGSIITALLFLL